MALSIKLLAGSQLGTTANTVVYSPAQGKCALIKSIILVNNSGSSAAIHIGIRNAAAVFCYIYPSAIPLSANSRLVLLDDITLAWPTGVGSAEKLEMWSGTSMVVHFCVSGVERDI